MRRSPVNKSASAAKFRGHIQRTKAPNIQRNPMRGGFRF